MVKAEIIIKIKDGGKLSIGLDLLKREDWNKGEWDLAEIISKSLLNIIEVISKQDGVELIKKKIITDKGE